MNIILIGFASSGKSSTAQALADATGWPHLDLDRVIEERFEQKNSTKITCRELVREQGIDTFTALETEALQSLSSRDSIILSTGGRTPLTPDNRPILEKMGKIVYLKTDIDTILIRMKAKGFPSTIKGGELEIEQEWRRRDPVYAELADLVIRNDVLSPKQTAAAILQKLSLEHLLTSDTKEP